MSIIVNNLEEQFKQIKHAALLESRHSNLNDRSTVINVNPTQ